MSRNMTMARTTTVEFLQRVDGSSGEKSHGVWMILQKRYGMRMSAVKMLQLHQQQQTLEPEH